ncbi:MAG: hypothetical protein HY369_02690 [Candidatus Aenigmarchaeota archaeon]|nr:hypothetical protein [Candidatus Aenigmarchaeota archaeon]
MNRPVTGTVVVLVAVVVIFLWLKAQAPAAVTHAASPAGLVEFLASSSNRIAIRSPPDLSWTTGETGTFLLAVKNTGPQNQTYAISVSLEQLDGQPADPATAASWITHDPHLIVGAGSVGLVTLTFAPAVPGVYLFRTTVCALPCSVTYATATFSFSSA